LNNDCGQKVKNVKLKEILIDGRKRLVVESDSDSSGNEGDIESTGNSTQLSTTAKSSVVDNASRTPSISDIKAGKKQ
jgi:hypothetical protein